MDSKLVFGERAMQYCQLRMLPSEMNGELIQHCPWPVVYKVSAEKAHQEHQLLCRNFMLDSFKACALPVWV